ncbi:MAG: hypothetical protein KatS3mg002_1000 [Candidatus Woesearchaeota archaeon]|jgi:hypothetical protein|nr:MAG: hypothetical protein KatS3mg002_1000 [Candidatus Woesearchaeota archaeon]
MKWVKCKGENRKLPIIDEIVLCAIKLEDDTFYYITGRISKLITCKKNNELVTIPVWEADSEDFEISFEPDYWSYIESPE